MLESNNHSYAHEILQPNKAPMELITCEKVKFVRLKALIYSSYFIPEERNSKQVQIANVLMQVS